MQLFFFTLIALVMLAAQCGQHPGQGADKTTTDSQQSSQSPAEPVTQQCDFSSYKPLSVSVAQAPIINRPMPAYPPEAKEQNIGGSVKVKILVNVHSGEVEQACVVEGDETLAKAAKEAALRIKFSPNWGNNKYLSERYGYFEADVTYNFVAK